MTIKRRFLLYTAPWAMVAALLSCAVQPIEVDHRRTPPPPPRTVEKTPPRDNATSPVESTSRETAASELAQRAQQRLQSNDPHTAIRILEKALQLNPVDGRNFFLMAEAWIQLKQPRQAAEYHRLAAMYLSPTDVWRQQLVHQKKKIDTLAAVE